MLKKYCVTVFFTLGLCAVNMAFAEENCEAAVDAADAMNVNQKPCDYSDEGLNGVLHKAFANNSAKNSETIAEASVSSAGSPTFLLRAQADQWVNVGPAKMQLLPQALAQCENGFRIVAEEYRPLKMGKIEITLQGVCL